MPRHRVEIIQGAGSHRPLCFWDRLMGKLMGTDEAPPRAVERYDIVQIDPTYDPVFGGVLLIVTQVHPWGVQGFTTVPNKGDAYFRVPHGSFAHTGGGAVWLGDDQLAEGDSVENHHG